MTSMSTFCETEYNITLCTLYNKDETHKLNSEGWKVLANRVATYKQEHSGVHTVAGVSVPYDGKYADNVPFKPMNWDKVGSSLCSAFPRPSPSPLFLRALGLSASLLLHCACPPLMFL